MYRDMETAVEARVQRLRGQITFLRSRGIPADTTDLLLRLRKNRREVARARRAITWLKHPLLRLMPRSIVEVMCSAGITYAAVLVAGLGTLIVCTLFLPLFV
jgi:hypothetical protein